MVLVCPNFICKFGPELQIENQSCGSAGVSGAVSGRKLSREKCDNRCYSGSGQFGMVPRFERLMYHEKC